MPKTHARLPETWKRYNPQNCTSCQAGCCTLPVKIDAEELYHMGFLEYGQVNGPLRRVAARLIKQGIIRSYDDGRRLFTLQRHANNDCVFLDEKRHCKIYDRRPNICRRFPDNSARPGCCPYIPFKPDLAAPSSASTGRSGKSRSPAR